MEDVILHIEDSEEDFESTNYALKKTGYQVKLNHIESGEAVIEMLDNDGLKGDINLIFLDLNLPGVGGIELLNILKNHQQMKQIPIVVLTSSKDSQDVVHSFESGANCYVQKPVDFKRYIQIMKEIYEFWFKTNVLPSYVFS